MPISTTKCSLPSFGSHLQPPAHWDAMMWGRMRAVSLHLGVISNRAGCAPTSRASAPCSLPSFGSHLQPCEEGAGRIQGDDPVQSPFIWESSPTTLRQVEIDWQVNVQSPFIWESSPTGGGRQVGGPDPVRAVSLHLGVISNLEPHKPLICKDFVPPFATASSWLPSVLSEIS